MFKDDDDVYFQKPDNIKCPDCGAIYNKRISPVCPLCLSKGFAYGEKNCPQKRAKYTFKKK